MNKYELMYIISSTATEEQREALIEKYKSFVEVNGGVVLGVDKLGMKKFAYTINFKNEGFYVLMNFEANDEVPAAITAKLNINRNIVRHMIIAK